MARFEDEIFGDFDYFGGFERRPMMRRHHSFFADSIFNSFFNGSMMNSFPVGDSRTSTSYSKSTQTSYANGLKTTTTIINNNGNVTEERVVKDRMGNIVLNETIVNGKMLAK